MKGKFYVTKGAARNEPHPVKIFFMAKLTTSLFSLLAMLALALTMFAQSKAGKSKILQPQMAVAPDGGTYKQPMGKLGEKSAEPWSATTLGASVDGKPNPGATKTVVGEIVDFSCYLQVGKHGDKHRDCAQKCFRNGQPIGLLTEDGGLYMLMEEEHDPRRDGMGAFRTAAIDHAGHIMEVTGTTSSVNGFNALYVKGFLKK
jgi:hypothetical protein